jgi:hypothetical protein
MGPLMHSKQSEHVESYYKDLFGKEPGGLISLGVDFWLNRGRLSDEVAQHLIKPFTLRELEEALKDMDPNASPGLMDYLSAFIESFRLKSKL